MKYEQSKEWEGIDGAIAFHLIETEAENWNETGEMMNAWLKDNQTEELLKMRLALELTRGNILSIKNAVGVGVIAYDIWLLEVEKALGINKAVEVRK